MQQFAWKEDDLILLRNDRLVAPIAYVTGILQMRVVNAQFPTFKLTGLAVEEVHKCEVPGRNAFASVVVMAVEEVAIVAGCNLSFHIRDGEFVSTTNSRRQRLDLLFHLQQRVRHRLQPRIHTLDGTTHPDFVLSLAHIPPF